MVAKKLEKLESLVSSTMEELRNLQAENQRLTKEVSTLGQKVGEGQEKYARAESQLQKLAAMEKSNRKLQDDKKKVRVKVKTIMQELENFDIPG